MRVRIKRKKRGERQEERVWEDKEMKRESWMSRHRNHVASYAPTDQSDLGALVKTDEIIYSSIIL